MNFKSLFKEKGKKVDEDKSFVNIGKPIFIEREQDEDFFKGLYSLSTKEHRVGDKVFFTYGDEDKPMFSFGKIIKIEDINPSRPHWRGLDVDYTIMIDRRVADKMDKVGEIDEKVVLAASMVFDSVEEAKEQALLRVETKCAKAKREVEKYFKQFK